MNKEHSGHWRHILVAAACCAGLNGAAAWAAGEEITMYKDAYCGCCGKWADHMRENGFKVNEIAAPDMAEVKRAAGVPQGLGSCHTAKVGGYVIEGHVPAADVARLLQERPALAGIAAPGMPLGSPGMEGPYEPQRYEVMGFDQRGKVDVFSRH